MKVKLPYAVRVISYNSNVRGRDGKDRRNTAKRYFETKEAAMAFCGNERRVLYVPQDKVFCWN